MLRRTTYETERHIERLTLGKTGLLEEIDGISLQDGSTHLLNGPSSHRDLRPTKVGAFEAFHITDARGQSLLDRVRFGEERDGFLRCGDIHTRATTLQSANGLLGLIVPFMFDN